MSMHTAEFTESAVLVVRRDRSESLITGRLQFCRLLLPGQRETMSGVCLRTAHVRV